MKTNNEITSEGRILRLKQEEKNFYMIDAENFSVTDEIFSHVPQSYSEESLLQLLKEATYMSRHNFWASRITPSYDGIKKCLMFKEGMPAVRLSTRQWEVLSSEYYTERWSRVATKYERALILAHIIKQLIKKGISEQRAWEAVCQITLGAQVGPKVKYEEERKIISEYEDLTQLKITFTDGAPELWSSMAKTFDVGYSFSYCDEAVALVVLTVPPEEDI